MRPFSTIGWFMCQAIGTMQLDRDASPLGMVARAWAADVGDSWLSKPLWGSRAGGKTDWDRRSGFPEKVEPMAVCPQCGDACPKSKVDDLHGVCDKCYWENEL